MTTPATSKPIATLYHIPDMQEWKIQKRAEIYEWEHRRLLRSGNKGVYIIVIDSICRGPDKRVDLTKSPLSKTLFEQPDPRGSYKEFEAIWQNKDGTASHFQVHKSDRPGRQKLYIQTPNDGGLFFSFHMVQSQVNTEVFHCILISCDPILDARGGKFFQTRFRWAQNYEKVVSILIPNALGHRHLQDTELRRSSLAQRLEDIETVVASRVQADFDELARSLHECNLELIKLRGRRKFENKVLKCFCSFTSAAVYRDVPEPELGIRPYREMFGDQWGIKNEPYYDFDELTIRITNSFTAIYNLVAQRDMRASVNLAAASQKIAEDALRDSTAMKTIAVMTLIFLPATFLCVRFQTSFFSMTLFNWSPPDGEPITKCLWIYFAALIPLTIVVIAAWLWFTRTTRERLQHWLVRKGWRKQPEKEKV